ncbi:MAG: heme ABC exporter ATP-binding protein CcmA [Alphaproteobacteria bacterium]|nr:heme ABC exporter ATP-binding protein CcmA [Alphaproteobacteria bacterium]
MDLKVSDLGCRRGEDLILSGVSFGVKAGRALILRGPNGSGKTTLLRNLVGLSRRPSGAVNASTDLMAYAAHADGIKSQLTVEENLRFWAQVFGTNDIDAAVEHFSLEPLLRRHAQHLSAGQKRRLGLSRLLLTGRPIWMLDEPTVSLDVENVKIFAEMIENHLATGGIAVIATHVDLGLKNADILEISQFRPRHDEQQNPFLDGAFS